MAILNDRLKDCRLQKDVTLLEVANMLGVKEATAQRYESGKIKNIPHDTVCALADYYGVSPQFLMGWTDDPRPAPPAPAAIELSRDEAELIAVFRSPNSAGQELVKSNARMLQNMPDYKA